MKKQEDKRTFEEVVHSIVQSEADVDTILKAAKLERHEKPENRMNAEQKFDLIMICILASLPLFLMFAFVLLILLTR